ncbi:MAG: aquaporin [Saprospiraceae bacterium]
MKKYFLEAIGTYFLTLAFILGVTSGTGIWVYGALLAGFIFIGFSITGAHYNPALTVGLLMQSKVQREWLPYYIVLQLAGAVLAGFTGYFLVRCSGVVEIIGLDKPDPLCTLPAEFLGSFAFALVYFKMHRTAAGQEIAAGGLFAGAALIVLAYMLQPNAAGIFNPAVVFGLCISGLVDWSDLWLYILAPLVGSAAAASVWIWLSEDEFSNSI